MRQGAAGPSQGLPDAHRWGGAEPSNGKTSSPGLLPPRHPSVHLPSPCSWQPVKPSQAGGHSSGWQGRSPSGPPPALVKALLSTFQSHESVSKISGSSKMRGPLPFSLLVFLQMGMSCNVSSKNSIFTPTDKDFPLRGLNSTSPLKVPTCPKK